MEEKKITEQESLELIARMIASTKENLEVGSGNQFLYWGYFSVFLSVTVFACVQFTGNNQFSALWGLMFVFWLFLSRKMKKPEVVTYIDRAIDSVWTVLGLMFCISMAYLLVYSLLCGGANMMLMMPFALLFMAIGGSMTGVIIRNKVITYLPLVSTLVPFYMFTNISSGSLPPWWHLLFGLAAVFSCIIPGHLLNNKTCK